VLALISTWSRGASAALLEPLGGDLPLTPPSYGTSLLQTLFALLGVCILAYLAMRFGLGRLPFAATKGRRMRIIERLPLDGRRALFLVEVDGDTYLIGPGESAEPKRLPDGAHDPESASDEAPSF
jgi:flagellar biogenesis protein FliO